MLINNTIMNLFCDQPNEKIKKPYLCELEKYISSATCSKKIIPKYNEIHPKENRRNNR